MGDGMKKGKCALALTAVVAVLLALVAIPLLQDKLSNHAQRMSWASSAERAGLIHQLDAALNKLANDTPLHGTVNDLPGYAGECAELQSKRTDMGSVQVRQCGNHMVVELQRPHQASVLVSTERDASTGIRYSQMKVPGKGSCSMSNYGLLSPCSAQQVRGTEQQAIAAILSALKG